MKWYARLYVGATLQKGGQKKTIMRQAEKGGWTPGVYLILLPGGKENQLEIRSMFSFHRSYPDGEAPMIVGMAFGRQETRGLLVQILQDVYDRTGSADIRGYLIGNDLAIRRRTPVRPA